MLTQEEKYKVLEIWMEYGMLSACREVRRIATMLLLGMAQRVVRDIIAEAGGE